jgi:hypothetical protein
MADHKATVASGADPNGQTLRQRVPGSTAPGATARPELDEKKYHGQKKVREAEGRPFRCVADICTL